MQLARAARDRGHAALASGNPLEAARWLDRALRLAPRDLNLTLSLASAVLAREPGRAASLFGRVAEEADLREAWQGLAAAHLLLGQASDAARCLARALSQAVIAPGLTGLADEVARRAGSPGWCGVSGNGSPPPASEVEAPGGRSPAARSPDGRSPDGRGPTARGPTGRGPTGRGPTGRGPTGRGPTGLSLVLRPTAPARIEVLVDGQPIRGLRLPPGWHHGARLAVLCGGVPLLGSPIDLQRLRRTVGYVEAAGGGIRGWAWHPANPDAAPVLLVRAATGGPSFRLTATDEQIAIDDAGPLARPRGFTVPAERLTLHPGPWHVLGPDGRDLLGSPLDPTADQTVNAAIARALARLYGAPSTVGRAVPPRSAAGAFPPLATGQTANAPAALPRTRKAAKSVEPRTGGSPGGSTHNLFPAEPAGETSPLLQDPAFDALGRAAIPIGDPPRLPPAPGRKCPADIVIPVHDNGPVVLACLESVLQTVPRGSRVIVVDDASDTSELAAALGRLASRRRIVLVRNRRNLGFAASANAGISAAPGRDVVLLNSDTLVPPNWLERLRAAIYRSPGSGTATPFSNAASILNYPAREGGNPAPDQPGTNRLSELAWKANGDNTVDIPVGVGFCLYIRRACLDAVGLLRADVFAQGYGEENDFCLRARALGWRHVAVPGVFVTHRGGASFGDPGRHLQRRNERILNQLHPGYAGLISAFDRADPLAEARRRLDLARWSAARTRTGSVLLITHADGGGVEQRVQQACAAHRDAGRRALILRPARSPDDHQCARLEDEARGHFPNLCFRMPDERPALLRLLRAARVTAVEVHHFLDHHPAVHDLADQLGVPYDVHVHDYAWFCPRVALVGADRRYCGEPATRVCEACVADAGRFITEEIPVATLIERSARFLASARQVVTPSTDTAARMRRHFPQLRPRVVPHENDADLPPATPISAATRPRVCVLGAIGLHKGYDVLLACARDAETRDLNLEFVVIGTTIDDARLLATDRVFVTGGYDRSEAGPLIRAQQVSYGLLPSIWPETWCLGLTELWKAGLNVAAFDIGAPAERIRRTGRGLVLPLGLPPAKINDALVAALSPNRDR